MRRRVRVRVRVPSFVLPFVVLPFALAGALAAQQQPAKAAADEPKLVAVVVHQNVEMLDFAGPVEVFAAARREDGKPAFRVKLVGPGKEAVRPTGLTAWITPDYAIADCPQPAVLVIPGGATNVLTRDRAFLDRVQELAPKCEVVLSVCTGAFVLADLGLLDGKQATTHHSALDALRKRYPKVEVVENRKFVDTGLCVTAAGVSSGIEGALHVVGRMCSPETAAKVAKYMEYAWPTAQPAAVAPPAK